MNRIEHSPARAGPNRKPTNMIATILALILAGANSEARVMLRSKGAAHADAGEEAEDAKRPEVMRPEESAVKGGEYDEAENERDLSADAVGEHAESGRAYHEADEAVRDDRAGPRPGLRRHPSMTWGITYDEDLRIIAVKDKGQYPENQEGPVKTVECQLIAKGRYVGSVHISPFSLSHPGHRAGSFLSVLPHRRWFEML